MIAATTFKWFTDTIHGAQHFCGSKCNGINQYKSPTVIANCSYEQFNKQTNHFNEVIVGSVAEWSIAAVLKTVGLKGSVGSNPTASANRFVYFSSSGGWCYSPASATNISQ